jgi:hypothetical protein
MINPNSYYTVLGWMREELGLKGNALAVYAIIYGFSQDGASEYAGSARYLAEWLGCDKKTVLRALADLTEKGHLVKRTTYQNGVTFCNYVAARNVQTGGERTGDKITPPGTKCPQGGEKLSLPPGTKCPQGGEKLSPHNTRDNTRYINKEIEREGAGAPPAPSGESEKGKKEPKHKYGEYKNVLLTDKELEKLQKDFPNLWERYVEELSAYIGSKGAKYSSHYITIRNWINRDKKKGVTRPPVRGGYAGPVGPNGIPIDPSKNDLDAVF